ncbi:unnamed protein product [Absidia cylindrospora]
MKNTTPIQATVRTTNWEKLDVISSVIGAPVISMVSFTARHRKDALHRQSVRTIKHVTYQEVKTNVVNKIPVLSCTAMLMGWLKTIIHVVQLPLSVMLVSAVLLVKVALCVSTKNARFVKVTLVKAANSCVSLH